eukprot:4097754-Pyramimonas_sp.AAC.1
MLATSPPEMRRKPSRKDELPATTAPQCGCESMDHCLTSDSRACVHMRGIIPATPIVRSPLDF